MPTTTPPFDGKSPDPGGHPPGITRLRARLSATSPNARLTLTPLPSAPAVSLYLLGADYPRDRLPDEVQRRIFAQPAYWAFCWASGQVIARWLFEHPKWVAGYKVLDFGSGSGVAGIAAALAGAAAVHACDNDPAALDATRANAEANKVHVTCHPALEDINESFDLVVAADVLYDRDNLPLLDTLRQFAPRVLVADSRVREATVAGYTVIHRAVATTVPDLDESAEYNNVRVYRNTSAAVRTTSRN